MTSSADRLDRIVVDPGIVHGKPRIRGTRLTVQGILELLAAGETIDELLGDYDELTREDVQFPRAGDSSDAEITALADTEGRVVVTRMRTSVTATKSPAARHGCCTSPSGI